MADQLKMDELVQRLKALEKEVAEQTEKAQLRQKELQSIIEATSRICHEMNQPLMAVSGYAELLSMEISEKSPLRDKIDKIIEQADKLSRIVQKLSSTTKHETKDSL